jgi:hypothetical protein
MNKLIPFGLLFVLSIAFIAADDDCTGIPTLINGVVYSGDNINTPPVPNVQVDVTCNGVEHSGMTDDPAGYYAVVFDPTENCDIGMQVEACVGDTCNDGIIGDCFQNPMNVLGVDIFNVPEFGLIAGGVAITGAIAGFLFLRKKN